MLDLSECDEQEFRSMGERLAASEACGKQLKALRK
jgi:hypothetical protein